MLEMTNKEAVEEINKLNERLRIAEQDIDRISEEKTSAVRTANYNLWQRIKPNFIEVMDGKISADSLSVDQRVLYRKLKSTYDALCDMNIVPPSDQIR
jgi:hypothetical protein